MSKPLRPDATRRKALQAPAPARRVWRISAAAPKGEFVEVEQITPLEPAPAEAPNPVVREESEGGWLGSSFDLLEGIEMTEGPEGLPPEDFDRLFDKASR